VLSSISYTYPFDPANTSGAAKELSAGVTSTVTCDRCKASTQFGIVGGDSHLILAGANEPRTPFHDAVR